MDGKKRVLYSEAAYVIGMITLAFGTALMEKADFGLSMVVAPAYLLHLKIGAAFSWFTFGMAEYCLQAVLLVITSLFMKRFKPMYLFSFVTAVIYGFTLDGMMALMSFLPVTGYVLRGVYYVLGLVFCSIGVTFFFKTYIAPEAYELLVKEIAFGLKKSVTKTKTVYDCCSCAVAIALSFAFFGFGHFEGVKLGTVVCALVNGYLIGRIDKAVDGLFTVKDAFGLRRFFE